MRTTRVSLLARTALIATFLAAALAAGPAFAQSDSPTQLAAGGEVAGLRLSPEQVSVGDVVTITATGLPSGAAVEFLWRTVEGGWVVEDSYRFGGKSFSEATRPLARRVAGPDGNLSTRFTVPEDYGGVHEVIAVARGEEVARGGVEVIPEFEMSPSSGPVGTPIEVRVTGLGWRTMESTYVLNWDNVEVGWISAVDSKGSGVARFRATGPPGDHLIKLYTGYMGQSYLNHEQAPTAYMPRPEFVFHTTPGSVAPATLAEPYPVQPVPAAETAPGIDISLDRYQGPVGTQVQLRASGLPARAPVELVWETWVGSRVTAAGFAPREHVLQQLTVPSGGQLNLPLTIPEDLGGPHSLIIRRADQDLARTSFVIETSIVDMYPRSGPAGTMVTIELQGVGWTEYDNILIANYDNGYMGYACGFNSQGHVVINFRAAGAPGVHLIDLYPGIYKGPPGGQQLYRLPQLTYESDHPGNRIPALRFAFEVTER